MFNLAFRRVLAEARISQPVEQLIPFHHNETFQTAPGSGVLSDNISWALKIGMGRPQLPWRLYT